ncbi:HlyD family efflux transporter periplasmic adaptor subunit [Candidatus Gracilibacteria bacterium]|nr:HlyD family efflux transporter periplasmic adaptor subunit [Candidatus Gracilibacteria bacterium]
MQKILAFSLLIPFFLVSCGKSAEEVVKTPEPKTPFYIETYTVGKKIETASVEKSARLIAGASLILTADSAGEITSINVKEGQKITKGSLLVSLKDTVNSYDIRLAQAQNGLVTQDATLESTKISLDRAISDTQIAYEQAKRAYDTLTAKNPLAYDTLVNSNQKTLDNLDSTYQVFLADMEKNMDQILFESDKILGVSPQFEHTNDIFEAYLGAQRGNLKSASLNSYATALSQLGEVRSLRGKSLTPENANEYIKKLEDDYNIIRAHVDDMVLMIQNNVISVGISQQQEDAWVAQWNGLRSLIQSSNSSFTTWKTSTLTFLKNYKTNELAVKVALEGLNRNLTTEEKALINSISDAKLLYEQNIIDLKDRMKSAELSLKQAENARDVAMMTKNATLAQLSANRNTALLSIDQAKRDYSKLSITSPFEGTVTKVMGTVGQRTNMGTQVLEVISNTPEVLVDLDGAIASGLSVGSEVQIKIGEQILPASIIAISKAAGSNLLYSTRISVPKAQKYIGSAIKIIFTINKETLASGMIDNILLPLKSVKIISEQEGQVAIFGTGNTLNYKSVKLGRVSGYGVEIVDPLDSSTEVILSDVENYDSQKNILVRKK